MYGYNRPPSGPPDPFYRSMDPYSYDQRSYSGESRREQAPIHNQPGPGEWYDGGRQENMASSRPPPPSLDRSRPGGYDMSSMGPMSQRTMDPFGSGGPTQDWSNRDKTAQAVAFLQKERRQEDLENQKNEVQRLRQEVQKSMETLQHLKTIQDTSVPSATRTGYNDDYRLGLGGPFTGPGMPPVAPLMPGLAGPPLNLNDAPRSILKKGKLPGEEDHFDDGRQRTNYCGICSIQFNTSREYDQHCSGLLHTKQLMQKKMGIQVSQNQGQGQGMSVSKASDNKTGSSWSELDEEKVKSVFNDYDYDYDESSGSQVSHFKASRYEEGGNVECKICDKKFYTYEELRNHSSQTDHCRTYLVMQSSLGTDRFMAKYGDVPFGMAHKDTSGPGDRYIRTDLSPRDQMRYKEFLARTGTLNNWNCRICNANTYMMEHWLAHCCGKKHAKQCMSNIATLSSDEYLQTFGDIPGPAPSKAVDAKMIEKWETVYIIDALKKPPPMSNIQKEQMLRQNPSGDMEGARAGPAQGLLGDFPGDRSRQGPSSNSPFTPTQQSPYSQGRDQSPYSSQSTPRSQQQSPYGTPNMTSQSPFGQQSSMRGPGYGQGSAAYTPQTSSYGQSGRPGNQSNYDDQDSPYGARSMSGQRSPPRRSGYGDVSMGLSSQDTPGQGTGQRFDHGPPADQQNYTSPGGYDNPYLQPAAPPRDGSRQSGYSSTSSRPDTGRDRDQYSERGRRDNQPSQDRGSNRDRDRRNDRRDDRRDDRHGQRRDRDDHHRSSSASSSHNKDKVSSSKSSMYDPFEQETSKPRSNPEKETEKEPVVSTTKALQMLHQLQEKQRLEQEKLERQLKAQKDLLEKQKREMEIQKQKHQEEIEKQNRQLLEEKKKLEDEKRKEELRRREKERELERERKLRLDEIRKQQQMKDDLERKRLQRQKEELERKKQEKIREEEEKKAKAERDRQELLARQLRMKLELEQKLKEELEAKKREQDRKAEEEKKKAEEMRKIKEKEVELQRLLNAKKLELEKKNHNQAAMVSTSSPWQQNQARGMPVSAPMRYPPPVRGLLPAPRTMLQPRPPFIPNQPGPLIKIPTNVQVAPVPPQLVHSAPWNAAGGPPADPVKPQINAPWNKGPSPVNKGPNKDKGKMGAGPPTSAPPPWGAAKMAATGPPPGKGGQKPPWQGKGAGPGKSKPEETAPWKGKKQEEEAPWKGRDGGRRKEGDAGDGRKAVDKDPIEDSPWKRRERNRAPSPRDRRSGRDTSRDDRGRNRDDDRGPGRSRDREPWHDRDGGRSRGRDSSERGRRRKTPDTEIPHEAPWHRKEAGEGGSGRKTNRGKLEGDAPWVTRRSSDHFQPNIEPGHCYKLVLDEREIVHWQMAQDDFMRCMDKGEHMERPLRIFTSTLRSLMRRIQAEKDNLPSEAISGTLSPEERGVVAQIQRMTGLEPTSVIVCTLQLLQSMAPRVFNILGSMDPNFMQSLISDAMNSPASGSGGGGGQGEARDVTPPWMRGTKRSGEQPYPHKRGKWN